MKGMLYLLFGLLVGATAHGQHLPGADSTLLQWKLKVMRPPGLSINGLQPSPDTVSGLLTIPGGLVRVLKPDRMPCLVADISKVERMPGCRSSNADPMPNGFRLLP
ncbi:MAG TPA: hypothetical protein VG052_15150 [Puia sp.]|jgi:hypothetical protein|nr:hypothetical protein [Puia sp.]HEV3413924.1 hypothetical protein [Puia sp.]